jgi:hypothetical protein
MGSEGDWAAADAELERTTGAVSVPIPTDTPQPTTTAAGADIVGDAQASLLQAGAGAVLASTGERARGLITQYGNVVRMCGVCVCVVCVCCVLCCVLCFDHMQMLTRGVAWCSHVCLSRLLSL